MFAKHRHNPNFASGLKRCPVCHHAVYSLGGIHPQCAIEQAESMESASEQQAPPKADSQST